MASAEFCFYAELNDFLPQERRNGSFRAILHGPVSVKDAVESLGAPHTEIDLILLNGEPAGFDAPVRDGDRVSVYPAFRTLEIADVTLVRPQPPAEARFVLDVHLGRLAAYLRLIGFDSLYPDDYEDANLARIAHDEARILLTRDRGLLKRSLVTHGYCLRSTDPAEQMVEVVRRFGLAGAIAPFRRCLTCNGDLAPVAPEEVRAALPEQTREAYREFARCGACGRIYWRGPHTARLTELIAAAAGRSSGAALSRSSPAAPARP
jgi:hypothetical protein